MWIWQILHWIKCWIITMWFVITFSAYKTAGVKVRNCISWEAIDEHCSWLNSTVLGIGCSGNSVAIRRMDVAPVTPFYFWSDCWSCSNLWPTCSVACVLCYEIMHHGVRRPDLSCASLRGILSEIWWRRRGAENNEVSLHAYCCSLAVDVPEANSKLQAGI